MRHALAAAILAMACAYSGASYAQAWGAPDARCQPEVRVDIRVALNSLRNLTLADIPPAPEPRVFGGFNQGCPLVTVMPQFSSEKAPRWTVFGRAGFMNYQNEVGSQDDLGGFGIKRTGPKLGTLTFGIRREF